MPGALELAGRRSAARIVAALSARFRDLDIAEEAFADACLAAARVWPKEGEPGDAAAWLYRAAYRRALDAVRHRTVRRLHVPDPPAAEATPEDIMLDDARLIPDERLRLIFICCHPALAPESRAALTLRLVCGLSAAEIAAAFLVPEATMLQRLTRAKRKIAEARVPFAAPPPEEWPDRVETILMTLEIAYAKAHADASGSGRHDGYAADLLRLAETLAGLMPRDGEVLGFAALVNYAEARRPARTDADGLMIPLSEQDPARWRRDLIEAGNRYLQRAYNAVGSGERALTAAIHGQWCARPSLASPPPWPAVLMLYDALLRRRDDAVIRLNRAVALAEVEGPAAALAEIEGLAGARMEGFQPWHAVRADLLRRLGRRQESRAAYERAIALAAGPAERAWLTRQAARCE